MSFARRPLTLVSVLAAAALLTSAPGASAATDAKLREVTLTQRSGEWGLGELTAGFGHVAWVERRGKTAGGQGPSRTRIAIRHEGQVRRTAWTRSSPSLELSRQVDQRSGRAVVRLISTTCKATTVCRSSLLSPSTLKPTGAVWATNPVGDGESYSVDGATVVRSRTVLDAEPTNGPAEQDYFELLPPSHCAFTWGGGTSAALPSLADCASGAVWVRGSLLVAQTRVPSQTSADAYFTNDRLVALDLTQPQTGWQQVAVSGTGKGGSTGAQSSCLLSGGVAILSGRDDSYSSGRAVPTWTLSFVPVGGAGAAWAARVPQLTPAGDDQQGARIACSGHSIYATYVASAGTGKKKRLVSHLVRLKSAA